MKSNMHRLPTLLCGAVALILSAGAMANSQDRASTAAQNSTPRSTTPAATSRSSMDNSMATTNNSSATAQTKFSQLDTNNDGKISKQEAQASKTLSREFAKLDSNKDNQLSLTEFMSATNMASIKVDKNNKTKGY